MQQIQKYNLIYSNYIQNGSAIIDERCNSWTAINLGTSLAYINGVPLNPGIPGTNNGESLSSGGNYGEIFYGRIDISFNMAVGNLLIIQKIYI